MNLQPMRGRVAKLHDCGQHGRLTAKQIAAVAGISDVTVYNRLKDGVRGESLCKPKVIGRQSRIVETQYRGRVVHTCGHTGIAVAVQLARAFPHRPPSVEELRRRFDMSRATAYRWRAAFVDAMGLQA